MIGLPRDIARLKDISLSTSVPLLMGLSMLLLMTLSMSLSMLLPRTRGTASDIAMSFWGPTSPGTAVSLLIYLKKNAQCHSIIIQIVLSMYHIFQ